MSISYILQTYGYWPFVLALVAMALTFPVKQPYKLLTTRIKTAAVRELLDRVILLFPVGIGIALWYIHNIVLKIDESTIASVMAGAATGGLAIVYYNLFGRYMERAILKKLGKQPLDDTPATSDAALAAATAIALGDKSAKEVAADAIAGDTTIDAALQDGAKIAPVSDETVTNDDEGDIEDDEDDSDEDDDEDDEVDDILYDLAEATGIPYDTLRAIVDRIRSDK